MTARLVSVLAQNWTVIDGEFALSGKGDILDLPLDRICNLAYHLATRNADENQLRKFDNRLWQPPIGEDVEIDARSPWSPENETAAFTALKAGLSGTAPSG